jgi:plastocyanin
MCKTSAVPFVPGIVEYFGPNKKVTGMTNQIRKMSSIGAVILLNTLLAGCGGISVDSKGAVEGTMASAPMAERGGSAGSMLKGTDAEAAPIPGPQQIVIDNFAFNPAKLTVAVGSQVTWVNHDDVPHTATSTVKPRVFNSSTLDTDDQFSYVFATPGTYDYFCALHPKMAGQIIVK